MFYKIDILNKSFYGLVECIFTTLPKFSLTQTEILHSFSKKDKKLDFTKTMIFNKIFLCTRWNKKTTNQQKNCRQNAKNFLHIVRKRQKTYSFPKIPIFPQIAAMDTFNQFLTKPPKVCRQKAKKFWWLSEKGKKTQFPSKSSFPQNCSYGHLECSFHISTGASARNCQTISALGLELIRRNIVQKN